MREQTFQRLLKPHSCGASWRDKKLPAGGTQPKVVERVFDKTKPADVLQAVHTSAIWCLFEQLMPSVFFFFLYFLPILCYNAYDKNT